MLALFSLSHAFAEPQPAFNLRIEEAIACYRDKDYITAATQLSRFPPSTQTDYYLAKSLHDLELYSGAVYYFARVIEAGPSDPYFKYALPRLGQIATISGDDHDLMELLPQPDFVPRQLRMVAAWLRCEGPPPKDLSAPRWDEMLREETAYLRRLLAKKRNRDFANALGSVLFQIQANAWGELSLRTARPLCAP